jgi:hypothetical protein
MQAVLLPFRFLGNRSDRSGNAVRVRQPFSPLRSGRFHSFPLVSRLSLKGSLRRAKSELMRQRGPTVCFSKCVCLLCDLSRSVVLVREISATLPRPHPVRNESVLSYPRCLGVQYLNS